MNKIKPSLVIINYDGSEMTLSNNVNLLRFSLQLVKYWSNLEVLGRYANQISRTNRNKPTACPFF